MKKIGFYEKGKVYATKKPGIRVRSKGEQQIANFLFEQEIEYLYEPLFLFGDIHIHPDFYLYEYGVFIEYFGVENNIEYDKYKKLKLELYEKIGIKVIVLLPEEINHFGAYIRTDFYKFTKEPFPQVKYFDWKK